MVVRKSRKKRSKEFVTGDKIVKRKPVTKKKAVKKKVVRKNYEGKKDSKKVGKRFSKKSSDKNEKGKINVRLIGASKDLRVTYQSLVKKRESLMLNLKNVKSVLGKKVKIRRKSERELARLNKRILELIDLKNDLNKSVRNLNRKIKIIFYYREGLR